MFRPGLHVYEMFIKPAELKALCAAHGIPVREVRGMSPNLNPIALMRLLRQRVKGEVSYPEVGKRFRLIETNDLNVSYMGYSLKG
jgi:2-polyprenyl-6-hydroxyphenyl methylase/3-demethylubiquinone-9 3-methyltransferase